MGFYYFDYTYFLFMLPALLISMVAQFKVNSTFQKYSRVNTARDMTGADAAMRDAVRRCIRCADSPYRRKLKRQFQPVHRDHQPIGPGIRGNVRFGGGCGGA